MNEALPLYHQLLQINQQAFEQELFMAAYHALAGALRCVSSLSEMDRSQKNACFTEVEDLLLHQIDVLNKRLCSCDLQNEPIELSLYTTLAQSLNSQRILLRISNMN